MPPKKSRSAKPKRGEKRRPSGSAREVLSLFEAAFRDSGDGQFLLSDEDGRFVEVNERFLSMTGYTREGVESGEVTPANLVVDQSVTGGGERAKRGVLGALLPGQDPVELEWTVECQDGSRKEVEVTARGLDVDGKRFVHGVIHEVGLRKDLERRLKIEIDKERRKTIEAAKASVRVFHLTEKLRMAPRVSSVLTRSADVDDALERVVEILTSREGMGYSQASVFRLQGAHLMVRASNSDTPLKRFHVDKGHRIAQIFRSGDLYYDARTGEIVVPFEVGGDPGGLLQIVFDEEERILHNDSEPVRLAQEHLVLMIAESIGLCLSKLELEAEVRGHRIEDPVSGLFNRPFFRRRLIQETRRSRRYHRDLSLLLFGFDRLSEIVQESGEDASDALLQAWGKTFVARFREIDVLARFAPTVFAVLLPETGLDEAIAKASDLREYVAKNRTQIEDAGVTREIALTVSIGVAANLEGIADPDELVKRAEESLYEAKRQGRDRVCYFRDSVQTVRRRYTTSLE